jgi:hypothetical protein
MQGCEFSSNNEKRRGISEEVTGRIKEVTIKAMKWYNNKSILLLNIFVGAFLSSKV